jgi:hypothetical protein
MERMEMESRNQSIEVLRERYLRAETSKDKEFKGAGGLKLKRASYIIFDVTGGSDAVVGSP